MAQRLKVLPKEPLCIASCLVFDNANRLLLLRRHTEDLGGGLWAAPGGKQEPAEDALFAALRETAEETGILLVEAGYLGTHEIKMPHGVVHIKTFTARVSDPVITLNPEEHDAHQWVALESLLEFDGIVWGLPTTLADFGLLRLLGPDPTLADGSTVTLLHRPH